MSEIIECPAIFFNDDAVTDVFFFKYELRSNGYHPVRETFLLTEPANGFRLETPEGCWTKPFKADAGSTVTWEEDYGNNPLEKCTAQSVLRKELI